MPEVRRKVNWTPEQLLAQAYTAVDLARRAGADDAVAVVTRHRALEFAVRDDLLEKVQEDLSRSLQVALYVDGRYSTHVTHDLEPSRLAAFLSEAVALSRHLEPDPFRLLPDRALYADRPVVELDLVDPAVAGLTRDDRLAWCRALSASARADDRVVSATAHLQDAHGIMAQVSTNGFNGTAESTNLFYGASVTLREGETKRPEAHRFVGGTHREGLPSPEEVGAEALRRAVERLGAAKVDSVRTTMVVHPEAASMLIGRVIGALTAGAVQQERSFLAGRRGERIGSAALTLHDEPLLPRALGSRLFDAEGISARPFAVVEDGVLRDYYVDTYYGRKLGWAPTTASPSNLVFRPGPDGLEQHLAQVGDGLLVTSWLGGNANLTTGDFSYGVRGHRIRAGKRAEPVSEMNVTGTYADLLDRLVAVGNDPLPWATCRTPTLVFEGVQFSGA